MARRVLAVRSPGTRLSHYPNLPQVNQLPTLRMPGRRQIVPAISLEEITDQLAPVGQYQLPAARRLPVRSGVSNVGIADAHHIERARELDPISFSVHGDGALVYYAARR